MPRGADLILGRRELLFQLILVCYHLVRTSNSSSSSVFEPMCRATAQGSTQAVALAHLSHSIKAFLSPVLFADVLELVWATARLDGLGNLRHRELSEIEESGLPSVLRMSFVIPPTSVIHISDFGKEKSKAILEVPEV
jgi:hypothetical protein